MCFSGGYGGLFERGAPWCCGDARVEFLSGLDGEPRRRVSHRAEEHLNVYRAKRRAHKGVTISHRDCWMM